MAAKVMRPDTSASEAVVEEPGGNCLAGALAIRR